ncbi:MAG TPA: hypothetical protein VJ476_05280 [Rhizomicrobium sp.]|nr:hypothetical protein [Rhizomicrobium sp.]
MAKIPVVATVVASYRYVFANYLRLLGITWASTVILFAVVIGLFFPLIMAMQQRLLSGDPTAALGAIGPMFLYEIVALMLVLVPIVGITHQVLGRKVTWPFFYLAIGGDYWRLVLASVIAGLIVLGVVFAVTIPVSIAVGIGAAARAGPHPDPVALAAQMRSFQPAILIAVYSAMLVVIVRFGFFLPTIVVEEKRLGIGRNWTLTRGNSWRIAGVLVLILIPLLVLGAIQFAALAVFGGPNYLDVFGAPPASLKASGDLLRLYLHYWYVYAAASLLLYPLFYGPILVASAHAYRAVAGEAPAAQD